MFWETLYNDREHIITVSIQPLKHCVCRIKFKVCGMSATTMLVSAVMNLAHLAVGSTLVSLEQVLDMAQVFGIHNE